MGGLQWWHVVVLLGLLALFVGALVSIARSRLSPTAKFVWILVCLVLQFFGPLAWFVWGRTLRPRPPTRPLY